MDVLRSLNVGPRFLVELCLLGALVFASIHLFHGPAIRWLAALGLPLLAAGVWGLFIAPKSRRLLRQPARLAVELLIFGLASILLYEAGYPEMAITFIAVAVGNRALLHAWDQDGP